MSNIIKFIKKENEEPTVREEVNLYRKDLEAYFGKSEDWCRIDVVYLLEQLREYFDESDDDGTLLALFATYTAEVSYTETYEKALRQLLWIVYRSDIYNGEENETGLPPKLFSITRIIGDILYTELFGPHAESYGGEDDK